MWTENGAERQCAATTMFQDYSGAFCALACLRSSISELNKALRAGRMDRVQRGMTESRFWVQAFLERRASARLHHGYKAPLPDMPDVIIGSGRGKR